MALNNYTLTEGYWKKISNKGESGTAWIKDANGFIPCVKIAHTTSVQPVSDDIPVATAINLDIDIAYKLPQHGASEELVSDDADDIFYATLRNASQTCIINADFTTV